MAPNNIFIGRRPLVTDTHARINSYNNHSLAPYLPSTGILTPLYFYRRELEIRPFNMARWLTPAVAMVMLREPEVVLEFTGEMLRGLLGVAADSEHGHDMSGVEDDLRRLAEEFPELENVPETGYFVRVSNCSLKDADDGNQQPIKTIYDALLKIIKSKRAIGSFLDLVNMPDTVDHKIYFFPYFEGLDKLSEWRCFIYEGNLVAISQTRFYQNHYAGVMQEALMELVLQARSLWEEARGEFAFESCVLDIYADVRDPDFEVRLIEMNPWSSHLGTGSLLFHWIDDKDILEPPSSPSTTPKTVLRLVKPRNAKRDGPSPYLPKVVVNQIGHGDIIEDELGVLKSRGLEWLVEPEHTERMMRLPVPGRSDVTVTRKAALSKFRTRRERRDGEDEVEIEMALHPRYKRMQDAYLASKSA